MIISIASGKGGTGKTLVATSLALSLRDRWQIQLLDCDVEEPNDHILLKPDMVKTEVVNIPVPKVDISKCTFCRKCAEVCAYHAIAVLPEDVLVFQQLCHGCGACSYFCPQQAISEILKQIGSIESGGVTGIECIYGELAIGEPMATPIIRKVKNKADRHKIVIIDAPPGTSCPVVESVKGSDYCVLVTEPTPFGLNDLVLALETIRELKIPCGIVLNRAGLTDSIIEEYCRKENLPVLLKIPLNIDIARLYSRGITLAEGKPEWRDRFLKVYEQIEEMAGERSCSSKR